MNLTANFTTEELLKSQTAASKGFTEQLSPPAEVIDNLLLLCQNALQPIRDLLPSGVIKVSSGYRCPRLNALIGGKPTSQHLKGQAADISWVDDGQARNKELFDLITKNNIPFDQLINEADYSWVHISYKKEGNRGMVLKL